MNPNPVNATDNGPTISSRPLPLAIEVAVLMPIGALANLFDPKTNGNPQCVARGRSELDIALDKVVQHISTAKGTGQLAIAFGVPILQRKLLARIDAARGRPPRPEPEPGEWPAQVDTQVDTQPASPVAPTQSESGPPNVLESSADAAAPRNDAEVLAIPGYDTLSASQIVERLAGLSEHDRDLLRRYELANRNRRTVLGKIDQLQAAGS